MRHENSLFQEVVAETVCKSRERFYPDLLEMNKTKLGETGGMLVRGQVVSTGTARKTLVQFAQEDYAPAWRLVGCD
ncbi:MAG: hypothetical protein BWY65_00112 [Firmicutes bacterium ADurb.Bin373]|nr:MAG: hypothetical protein BWY65_00112 [Firmicutes bacterium ADurb.Bin373]